MKSVKKTFTIQQLEQLHSKKGLDFNLIIQRKKNIWDLQRKSMFIHSILSNLPIPNLYATRQLRSYSFIDGKQRLTCVLDFIEDGFALDKTVASIEGVELAGKKFSELPEHLQKKIKAHKLDLYIIEEATMEELEDLFFRLNNGMPLKQIETTRAILGGKLLLYVESIANTPFFQEKVNLSKTARQRFADQELVLQILSLIHKRDAGFSGRELQNFVKELRKEELQKELVTKIQNVCYYLNTAFPKKEKFLKKINIPPIFIIALENQEQAQTISPEEFGEWCQSFFANIPDEYFQACQSGSAKKENVQKRISEMKKHHDEYFKDKIRRPIQVNQAEALSFVMEAMENPEKMMDLLQNIDINNLPSVNELAEGKKERAKRNTNTATNKTKAKATESKNDKKASPKKSRKKQLEELTAEEAMSSIS